MQDVLSYMTLGDIAFKQIIHHDELLIDFLNSFFEYNHEGKKVIKVKAEIKENKQSDGQIAFHVNVLADLTTGEKLPMHIYKKGDKLLIANIKKGIEV